MFTIAMTLQIPRFKVSKNIRVIVFAAWAAYGILPTFRWTVVMGGMKNPIVSLLLPRVFTMYIIALAGTFMYVSRFPERYFTGNHTIMHMTN